MSKWTLQIPFDVKKSPFDTKYLQRNKSSKRGLWLQWRKKVLLTFLWNIYYPEDTTDICNYHHRYRCWRTFFHKDSNKNINDAINTTTNMSTKSWKTLQILSQGNLCWKIMHFGFFRIIICGKRQISGTAWKVVFRFLKSLILTQNQEEVAHAPSCQLLKPFEAEFHFRVQLYQTFGRDWIHSSFCSPWSRWWRSFQLCCWIRAI